MSTDYEDQMVSELRDQLRDRDLMVSGTKDELIDRLEEDDAGMDQASRPGTARGSMSDVLARLQQDLQELAGLQPERTFGLTHDDDGWRAKVEVLELSRIPPSTDILATYEVVADDDGSIISFDRLQRYRRSEVGT